MNFRNIIAAVSCIAAGFGAGYYFGKKKVSKCDSCPQKEAYANALKNFIGKQAVQNRKNDIETYKTIVDEYATHRFDNDGEDPVEDESAEEYEVIDAFLAGADDYPLSEITYYVKDHKFTDEVNDILTIEEVSDFVGEDHLNYFISGSSDEIYIRNNNIQRDFAIIKDLGAYSDVFTMSKEEA